MCQRSIPNCREGGRREKEEELQRICTEKGWRARVEMPAPSKSRERGKKEKSIKVPALEVRTE
eukprot:273526-Rhodomonas_salina.1